MPPPGSSTSTISVIVPTYHRPKALRETLAALVAVDHPREFYEIIVVDDGDDRSTAEIVDQLNAGASVRLIRGEGLGPGSARNQGAEVARNKFLIFCDDDVIVAPDHLRRHLEVQGRHGPSLCAALVRLDESVVRLFEQSAFGRYRLALQAAWADGTEPGPDGLSEVEMISACNLSLPRSLFEGLGGFDGDLPFAAEDQDLSFRAAGLGFPRLIDHRNRVRHLDTRLDFPNFCEREERGAQSYAVFARKLPDTAGRSEMARANDPASFPGEGVRARAGKRAKRILGRRRALRTLHTVVRALEWAGASDSVLRRAYTAVIGVHIARGYRRGLTRETIR